MNQKIARAIGAILAAISLVFAGLASKYAPPATHRVGSYQPWGGGSPGGSTGEIQTNNGAGGFSGATNVKAGSGFVSIGSNAASSGALRLTSGAAATTRNNANSANKTLFSTDASDNLFLGNVFPSDPTGFAQVFISPTTAGFLRNGDNAVVEWTGSSVLLASGIDLEFGTTVPSAGNIRFPYNGGSTVDILTAKDSTGTDRSLITYGAADRWDVGNGIQELHLHGYLSSDITLSDGILMTSAGANMIQAGSDLYLGTDSSFTGGANATNVIAASSVALDIGSTTYFYANSGSAANESWVPTIGSNGGSSPYSTHGDATVSINSLSSYTVASSIYAYETNNFTCSTCASGTVTITYPRPPVGGAFHKWIIKGTTGGNTGFTITNGGISTCSMALTNNITLWVMFDHNGCHPMATAQTY